MKLYNFFNILPLLLFGVSTISNAQNPFESLGVKDSEIKTLSLSKGKYEEVITNDTLAKVGSVVINTLTGEIAYFIETDTVYSEATLKPEIISKWLSPDPIFHPYESPYTAMGNNPILYIDSDGRKIDLSQLSDAQLTEYNAMIQVLSKSDMFREVYRQLEASNQVFVIGKEEDKMQFQPNPGRQGGTISLGNFSSHHIAAQEFFHAFQSDNIQSLYPGFPTKTSDTDIETEGDWFSYFVAQQVGDIPYNTDGIDNSVLKAEDQFGLDENNTINTPSSGQFLTSFDKIFQESKTERFRFYENLKNEGYPVSPTYLKFTTDTKAFGLFIIKLGAEQAKETTPAAPRQSDSSSETAKPRYRE